MRSIPPANRASTTTWASALHPARFRAAAAGILADMRERARLRNLDIIQRVNAYLAPVILDYEADVLPLTPAGTATERHIVAGLRPGRRTHRDRRRGLLGRQAGHRPERDGCPAGEAGRFPEPGAHQADEAWRRRLCRAEPRCLPARRRVSPADRGLRRAALRGLAGWHVGRRAGHGRAAGPADRPGRGRAQHHPRPQLESGRSRPAGAQAGQALRGRASWRRRWICRSTSAPR